MAQRETPRETLMNLGKVLAPKSKPISSSSSSTSADTPPSREKRTRDRASRGSTRLSMIQDDLDDLDDDFPLDKPRLSLPIADDDDSEEDLRPPRLSGVEEENYTVQSIELPRRVDLDRENNRLDRGSLGSVRVSDLFDNNEPTEEEGRPSDFFPGLLEDLQARAGDEIEYERIDDDVTRRSVGGESDFGLQPPVDLEDQTTFLLDEPAGEGAPTSPIIENSFAEAMAADADAGDPMGDVSDREPLEDVGGFSDREPMEDISDRSDEGGIPMPDAFSDRGGDEVEVTEMTAPQVTPRREAMPARKKSRISRHGIEYPSLPPAFVKRVAQTALQSSGISNPRVSADTLTALTQASEWFFEQLGDDLGAYASHAKRKTVEEADMVTLMRRYVLLFTILCSSTLTQYRQRQIRSNSTAFSLAQKHLPRELLQELRMPPPRPSKKTSRGKRPRDEDGEAEEA